MMDPQADLAARLAEADAAVAKFDAIFGPPDAHLEPGDDQGPDFAPIEGAPLDYEWPAPTIDQVWPLEERAASSEARTAKPVIHATPYLGRDPATIPPRPWIFGRWLLRRAVTEIIAPGGVGKSKFIASTALSLATGKPLLGKAVWEHPQRAWVWNLEDDADELAREIEAAALAHGVDPSAWGDRLFVDSGLTGPGLCTATEDNSGPHIIRPVVDALTAELIERNVDALFVDPFVSSHQVSENSNGAIDLVVKEWGRVATAANCAIVLSHHTRKLGGEKVTAESSRGASAMMNAARVALALNRMDADEAERFGIEGDDERRRYFSVQDDKHNRAPAEKAAWFRLESVELGNGDNVGAVTSWMPPQPFDGLTWRHLRAVQNAIDGGEWREDYRAAEWAGHAVAQALDFDADKDRKRISALLREWTKSGALITVTKADKSRRPRKFLEVGTWADETSAPLNSTGANSLEHRSAKSAPLQCSPIGGATGAGAAPGETDWSKSDWFHEKDPAADAFDDRAPRF